MVAAGVIRRRCRCEQQTAASGADPGRQPRVPLARGRVAFLGSLVASAGAWLDHPRRLRGQRRPRRRPRLLTASVRCSTRSCPPSRRCSPRNYFFARTLPAGDGVLLVSAAAFAYPGRSRHRAGNARLVGWRRPSTSSARTGPAGSRRSRRGTHRPGSAPCGAAWSDGESVACSKEPTALLRHRWRGARVIGCQLAATKPVHRAAAAVPASVGVRSPLTVALIVTAALDPAGLLPFTPGNVGVTTPPR